MAHRWLIQPVQGGLTCRGILEFFLNGHGRDDPSQRVAMGRLKTKLSALVSPDFEAHERTNPLRGRPAFQVLKQGFGGGVDGVVTVVLRLGRVRRDGCVGWGRLIHAFGGSDCHFQTQSRQSQGSAQAHSAVSFDQNVD